MSTRYPQGAVPIAGVSSATSPVTTRAGSTLLIAIASQTFATSPVAINSVTVGGVPATLIIAQGFGTKELDVFKFTNCPAGTLTVAVDFVDEFGSANIDNAIMIIEEIADVTPSGVDKIAVGIGTSTAPNSGATAAIAQDAEMGIAFVATRGPVTDAAPTWGLGFTAGLRAGSNTGVTLDNVTLASGWKALSGIAGYTAAATLGVSRAWCAVIVTLVDFNNANKSRITFQVAIGNATQKASIGMKDASVALPGPMTKTLTIGED